MPFENIEPHYQLEELTIFPNQYEVNQHILYHGTSSLYESSFETNGAIRFYNHFTNENLTDLILLMRSMNLAGDGTPFRAITEYQKHGTRFSLTPISLLAADHALIRNSGGKIGSKILDAIRLIDEFTLRNNLTNEQTILRESLENLRTILTQRGTGMILAFEFSHRDEDMLDFNLGVVYPKIDLSSKRIVGKILLPPDFVIPNVINMVNQAKAKAKHLGRLNGTFCKAISDFNFDKENKMLGGEI